MQLVARIIFNVTNLSFNREIRIRSFAAVSVPGNVRFFLILRVPPVARFGIMVR